MRCDRITAINPTLKNTGWTDEARAASLAVQRAKAAERRRKREIEELFEWRQQWEGKDLIENWYHTNEASGARDGK